MLEYFFQCPYCFEEISILVDTSVQDQDFIEDCEVCCNPIQFIVKSLAGRIQSFEAEQIGQ
jgi:transcription elongation factor Elf1